MIRRDLKPLTCPPAAMLPTGDGKDGMQWSMVVPVDVEMFGFGALIAVGEVWTATFSAN